MGFIICQLVSRCSGDKQIDHKDELNSSTDVGGQPLQTVSLSCSGPSILVLFSVINCPPESYRRKEKPCSCVCVCTSLLLFGDMLSSTRLKEAKTESVVKCPCCKPIYIAIREGNIWYCWSFLTKQNKTKSLACKMQNYNCLGSIACCFIKLLL